MLDMFIHLGHLFINLNDIRPNIFLNREQFYVYCLYLCIMAGKYASQCFTPLFSYMLLAVFSASCSSFHRRGSHDISSSSSSFPSQLTRTWLQIYQQFLSPKKRLPIVNHYSSLHILVSNGFHLVRFQIYFAVNYTNLKALGYLYIS